MLASISRWFKANPRTVFLVVVGVVILGLFLGVITPLFATSGRATADLSGALPSTATAGKRLEVDVSIDNTGDSIIASYEPFCDGVYECRTLRQLERFVSALV